MDSLLINQQIEIKKTDSQLTYLIQTDSLLKKQVFLQIGQNYILGNELQEIKKGHDLDYISARNSFQATIGKVGRLLQDLRQRYGGGTDTFKDSYEVHPKNLSIYQTCGGFYKGNHKIYMCLPMIPLPHSFKASD